MAPIYRGQCQLSRRVRQAGEGTADAGVPSLGLPFSGLGGRLWSVMQAGGEFFSAALCGAQVQD
jgi:hypothetical protein